MTVKFLPPRPSGEFGEKFSLVNITCYTITVVSFFVLLVNLCVLQELYPANDDAKLRDLVDTCQMMGTVLEFQQQAMGIMTTGKLSDMIVDSMKVGSMVSYQCQNYPGRSSSL